MLERKMQENTIGTLQVYGKKRKLPTLKITKFKGSITDWVRFWQQLEKELADVNTCLSPISPIYAN